MVCCAHCKDIRVYFAAAMSLDKAIEHGKEHRKPYRGSKAIDPSCRNHGGCPWCEGNRLYRTKKELEKWRNRLVKIAMKDI